MLGKNVRQTDGPGNACVPMYGLNSTNCTVLILMGQFFHNFLSVLGSLSIEMMTERPALDLDLATESGLANEKTNLQKHKSSSGSIKINITPNHC